VVRAPTKRGGRSGFIVAGPDPKTKLGLHEQEAIFRKEREERNEQRRRSVEDVEQAKKDAEAAEEAAEEAMRLERERLSDYSTESIEILPPESIALERLPLHKTLP